MRETQGSVYEWDSASFCGARELHSSQAGTTGSCFGSSSLQDGTRLAPLPRPAWLPGALHSPRHTEKAQVLLQGHRDEGGRGSGVGSVWPEEKR